MTRSADEDTLLHAVVEAVRQVIAEAEDDPEDSPCKALIRDVLVPPLLALDLGSPTPVV